MSNPYSSAKNYQLWYKSVSAPAPGHIDPVTKFRTIRREDKIATIGSCFAQHLSQNVAASGFNYYVVEKNDPDYPMIQPDIRNYGVFSARYGNVYTARQALQLFNRAFGQFEPELNIWEKDGRYFDAFRPQIEPRGYSTAEALLTDRQRHLASVREMFRNARWLIFTLGLTEAWVSKTDGAVLPTAPGVVAGTYDPQLHFFVNYSAKQVTEDLAQLVERVRGVNEKLEIILTVSPVPLVATYEDRHVLVSTTLSKAALRVAADEIEKAFDNVVYFPSYEIITSAANGGRYFDDDLRQVTDLGVSHVMRVFRKHFLTGAPDATTRWKGEELMGIAAAKIVCDEETIAQALETASLDWRPEQ